MPDLDNMDNMNDDSDGGDSDLEAELAAMTGQSKKKPKPQRPKTAVSPNELDRMVAESMRDIDDDEDDDDDDDPNLLDELATITGDEVVPSEDKEDVQPTANENEQTQSAAANDIILPTTALSTVDTIKSRIEMYKLSEKMCKEAGETGKARSRARGIKSLESLLKQALSGKPINLDDIPPEVLVKAANKPTDSDNVNIEPTDEKPKTPEKTVETENVAADTPNAAAEDVAKPAPSSPTNNEEIINKLLERQREYKMAALEAKKAGNMQMAIQYVKISKVFDVVLTSARNNEQVDLSDMPPPPSEAAELLKAMGNTQPENNSGKKEESEVQQSNENQPAKPALIEVPPPEEPKTILEALTQRLQKYQAAEANAKAEGNDRKARQNGRIIKQYQDAIRMHKAKKPVAFDELPAPPGMNGYLLKIYFFK